MRSHRRLPVESADARRFVYCVDAKNELSSVNPDWVSFAEENGAQQLKPDAVVGRPLLSFVEGMEAKHLYGILMARVREHQRVLEVPFRCDAPSVRRFMRLRVSPLEDSGLEFVGWIVREEQRKSVALTDASAMRSDEFLGICSWCKKVRVDSAWVEAEEAIERLRLFQSPEQPRLTHGICPSCDETVRRELNLLRPT